MGSTRKSAAQPPPWACRPGSRPWELAECAGVLSWEAGVFLTSLALGQHPDEYFCWGPCEDDLQPELSKHCYRDEGSQPETEWENLAKGPRSQAGEGDETRKVTVPSP